MKSKLIYLIIFVSLISLNLGLINAVAIYPEADSNNILYLKFANDSNYGENTTYFYDYSGKGNNATKYSAVVIYNSTDGIIANGSIYVNGRNDGQAGSLVVNQNSGTNLSNSFTFNMWIKPRAWDTISKYFIKKTQSYQFYNYGATNLMVCRIYNSTAYVSYELPYATHLLNASLNIWEMISCVYNGSTISQYRNGILLGSTPAYLGSINITSSPLQIGGDVGYTSLNGSIDEVLIYNRSLSTQEISNLYHHYSGYCGSSPYTNCEAYSPYNSIVTFDGGTYSPDLNLTGDANSYFHVYKDNIIVNCNNTKFIGNWSGIVGSCQDNSTDYQGNVSCGTTSHGLFIDSVNNVTLQNCYFNNFMQPIYLFDSTNVILDNFTIINQDQSIFTNMSYLTISNSNIINTTRYGLDFYNGNSSSSINRLFSNINIYNNNFTKATYNSTGFFYVMTWPNQSYSYFNISNNHFDYQAGNFANLNHSFFEYNVFNNQYPTSDSKSFYAISCFNNSYSYNNISNSYGAFHNIWISDDDSSTLAFNNYFNNSVYTSMLIHKSRNTKVYNNSFNIQDQAIQVMNSNNVSVFYNFINNTLTDFDGYDSAIIVENNATNVRVYNNSIYNVGHIGVFVRATKNINVTDNIISMVQFYDWLPFPLNRNFQYNRGEFPCAVGVQQLLQTWIDDNGINYMLSAFYNESYTYANLSTYYDNQNIQVLRNTFLGRNMCYLHTQGVTNLTHDLTNYWSRSFQFPTQIFMPETYYINSNYSNLSLKTSVGEPIAYKNIDLLQTNPTNYSELGFGGIQNRFFYSLKVNKNYMYFKNLRKDYFGSTLGLNLFNLTSPLISLSNGTNIYNSGSNLEYNLSLNTNNYVYVFENYGNLSRCDGTNNFTILNFTFVDEKDNTKKLNGTIQSAIFNYYPEGLPVNASRSYNFTSSELNISYPICISDTTRNYYIDYTIVYSGDGYSQRTKTTNGYVLYQNQTNPIILNLLNSTNVITFQVINSFTQAITGAYVYVLPYLNDTVLMSGYTDSGGIIQFLMDNNTNYRVYFSKSGYDNYNTLLNPTQTYYTITLSGLGVSVVTPPDYGGGNPTITNSKGVTYTTRPQVSYLSNDTFYNFSLTIDSGTWNLTLWGFNVTDQDNNLINATSSTIGSGGTVSLNVSTLNYTKIIMNYYYEVNNTRLNLIRVWTILDLSDNSYSINHAVSDITSYVGSGLFGLTSNGLSFVVFFIIFIGAGVLSYKFGLTNPVAICGFVFAMIWLFDVSLGWIPTPINAIPHIATWLVAFVFVGFIVREVAQ